MLRLSRALLREIRPKQWTKNGLLFAGLVFSGHVDEFPRVLAALGGFAVFCALASVVYIFNDLRDVEGDRKHPLKKNRPIASGDLPIPTAIAAAFALSAAGLVGAFALHGSFGLLASIYFALMLAYSYHLKHLVILDLMIVAVGFVMRALAGFFAIQLSDAHAPAITPWFLTCILFGAFLIVICKRRHEIILLSDHAISHRPVLEHYSEPLLDQMVSMAAAGSVVSYSLYAILGVRDKRPGFSMEPHHPEWMVYTVPLVLYGVCRYLYLVYSREEGGAPEILLLQDWPLLITVASWLVAVMIVFYYR